MAGHDRKKQVRSASVGRRLLVGMGAGAGVFFAAAAMATGSAAPAKADFEDLLDPIIQPILTSLTDSIGAFDPAAAVDLTSWTDSFLASLNSIDLAVPAASEPAAATTISGTDIPLTVQEGTEPTVDVSVDGSTAEPTLVDTGSSGLLVPINNLSLTQLIDLGFPTGINSTSFSGGVDVFYLEYNDATVDYGDGAVTTTNTPINVEFFSFPTSLSAGSPLDFQQFLTDDDSPGGILGIGDSGETGPGTSPFEAVAGVSGVTVDVTGGTDPGELVVGSNAGTPIEPALNGGATPLSNLTETVTTSTGTLVGTATVSDDVDSGGVFGTIPSTLVGTSGELPDGDTVSVYDGTTLLYSYEVENNGVTDSPEELSSGDTAIDSGFGPFNEEPIFISYSGTEGAITFDKPLS
jgi:hypothetical protein